MALKVAEVLIKWRGEGADQVAADTKKLGDSLTSIGEKAKTAGAVLSAGLTAPLLLIGKSAVTAASDLNEAMSAVETTFGNSASSVLEFSRTAASQLGQSRQAALSAAAGMGALFKGVGLGEAQMAEFSKTALTAAADLGSFYNVEPGEALDKIRSGLVGETEGLRTFGIVMNEATVKAQALKMGLGDVNGELTEGEKVQARYAYIMASLGPAAGDAARTHDSFANTLRRLQSTMVDLSAEIGQILMPYMNKLTALAESGLARFASMSTEAKTFAVAIGAVAAAAGPVLIILGQVVSTIGTLAPLFAALTGPLGLAALAVVGLGVAFKENWFGIRDLVTQVTDRVGDTIGRMVQFFTHAKERGLDPFSLAFRTLIVTLSEKLGADNPAVELLQGLYRNGKRLGDYIDQTLTPALSNLASAISLGDGDKVGDIMEMLLGDLVEGWNKTVAPWLRQLGPSIQGAFALIPWATIGEGMVTGAAQVMGGLLKGLWDHREDILTFFKNVLLPGIVNILALGPTITIAAGAELIDGLRHGAQDVWNNQMGPWLQSLSVTIQGLFQTSADWLASNGASLISGLYNGATSYWENTLLPWIRDELPAGIQGVFANAGTWLVTQGSAILDGLRHGIVDYWNNTLMGWFQGMSTSFQGFFNGAGDWLVNAGTQVIEGLWSGASKRFEQFKTDFQGMITGWAPDWSSWSNPFDTAPTVKPAKDDAGGGGGSGDFRAFGGPLGKRLTMVGEFGPELLINKSLVMPHGASMSRLQAMGGMAYGGTGSWSEWLASRDRETRARIRAQRASGELTATMRRQLMEDNPMSLMSPARQRDPHPTRRSDSAANRMHFPGGFPEGNAQHWMDDYSDRTGDRSDSGRRAFLNNYRNSDALNRANDYGDRTGDYARRDRVLAREARNGTLQQGGLSSQEKSYLINNYGTIHVQAKDSNVARAIGDQLSSRDR